MAGVELLAVFEAPYYEGDPPWAWPVSRLRPCSDMRLSGASTPDDVGLFFGALSASNSLEWDAVGIHWASDLESHAGRLKLAGGLQLCIPGAEPIRPGCCAGIEAWAEFWRFSTGKGQSPWWGHDPDPCVDREGDDFVFWRSGGITKRSPDEVPIRIRAAEFRAMLQAVQQDLLDFLLLAGAWLQARGVTGSDRIIEIIDQAFAVSNPDRWSP